MMTRTLLILSGALLVGGVALLFVYMNAYTREETGGPRIPVVTAAIDIPFGEPIQPGWLDVEELPQSYVEERHIRASDLRDLIGVSLAQSVRAGEAILRTDLSTLSGQQRTLSGEIPQGKRAVSIHARAESSFAGLLRPGDRVDVLLVVFDHRIPGSGRAVVVAQNLLVLSVGLSLHWEYSHEERRPEAGLSAQVSLEVRPEEAQRLTLAESENGRMRLLMRNANDVSVMEDPPEVLEPSLFDPAHRAEWLRRFALVERPTIPAPEAEVPAGGEGPAAP